MSNTESLKWCYSTKKHSEILNHSEQRLYTTAITAVGYQTYNTHSLLKEKNH